ncbi:PEPxxWA-CTERM sorting domain-containing protein [Sphingomonas sp. AP4-R1]|nr:PEPxxWA-CTERM sorting domain-containing protein [Sphingomonas sp. AP4-R1]
MSTPANFTIDVSGTASMPCGTFCSLTYVDTFVRHIEDPEILALFTSTDPIQARTYANIYAFGSADSSFDGTLTYTYGPTRTSDAPEPATWAMMITGFLATGTALRRRRRLAPLTA